VTRICRVCAIRFLSLIILPENEQPPYRAESETMQLQSGTSHCGARYNTLRISATAVTPGSSSGQSDLGLYPFELINMSARPTRIFNLNPSSKNPRTWTTSQNHLFSTTVTFLQEYKIRFEVFLDTAKLNEVSLDRKISAMNFQWPHPGHDCGMP